MRECWSEGELRAYIDRELPPEEIALVAAHLEQCSECGDLWAELAGRADRVSALMHQLAVLEPEVAAPRMAWRAGTMWRWVGAAAALAAGVLIGILALHRHATEVAVAPPPPPAMVQTAAVVPEPPPAAKAHNAVTLAASRPAKAASFRRNRKPPAPSLQTDGPFLALDDEPIESGVVWRVELGPRSVPAEVIVDSDGRPRAIRLVNFKSNH